MDYNRGVTDSEKVKDEEECDNGEPVKGKAYETDKE